MINENGRMEISLEDSTKNAAAAAKSLQSCPTLCDPIDGSPPGSFVHGIFQARVLEWGAIAFSEENAVITINSDMVYCEQLYVSPGIT